MQTIPQWRKRRQCPCTRHLLFSTPLCFSGNSTLLAHPLSSLHQFTSPARVDMYIYTSHVHMYLCYIYILAVSHFPLTTFLFLPPSFHFLSPTPLSLLLSFPCMISLFFLSPPAVCSSGQGTPLGQLPACLSQAMVQLHLRPLLRKRASTLAQQGAPWDPTRPRLCYK